MIGCLEKAIPEYRELFASHLTFNEPYNFDSKIIINLHEYNNMLLNSVFLLI